VEILHEQEWAGAYIVLPVAGPLRSADLITRKQSLSRFAGNADARYIGPYIKPYIKTTEENMTGYLINHENNNGM
jgi:hypothetical protein